ncbi:Hypothetical predicted protein [Lecanosticta acicola]|uniref:DNA recombination and repair protein Rad51-like C-terminal domain-containing protein n=1 Tax=Lecanosticta acicola TaxID=111012 RepID=A0AAI8W0V3_9PEZI|nr:Hypothetical predicted protein [Lecanosticta acicola]
MSVEDLGKRSLAEAEEVGLDEILNPLRVENTNNVSFFGLPPLDHISKVSLEVRTSAGKSQTRVPIVELMSMAPCDGKTSLLYHLTAIAVLPAALGGRQAAVIILDTDGRYSVSRLVQQLQVVIRDGRKADEGCESPSDIIHRALKHVHLFHPQSLASTVATARSLEKYLFDAKRHYSFDRHIGLIVLDSASSSYWQNKSEVEDAALLANTSGSKSSAQPNGYVQLAAALKNASRIFCAPVVFTSRHLGPAKSSAGFALDGHSIRPSLPPPWQDLPSLRMIVQRTPVRKLPVEISVEEAKQESEQRQKVVEQGRFECFVNEWGLDERTLEKLRSAFEFYVSEDGVKIENGQAQ